MIIKGISHFFDGIKFFIANTKSEISRKNFVFYTAIPELVNTSSGKIQ